MLLYPWLRQFKQTLRHRGLRSSRPARRRRRRVTSSSERLEDRTLLSVTSTFNPVPAELTITSDAADPIVVAVNSGEVTVNGQPTGVQAADVRELQVEGGPGANNIDLSAVTPADFPNLHSVEVHGRGGNDTVVGTALDDSLFGEEGDDELWGGAGNDTLTAGLGDDELHGEDGVDLLDAGLGDDTAD
ncbi:MAG: hypothetical protein GXP27_04760, partial [Planctomycetes bacterium]|nr:hypothetical protein [Planctomycetota bacterium]